MTDFLRDYPDGVIVTMDNMSVYSPTATIRVWFLAGQISLMRVSSQRDALAFRRVLALRSGYEIALNLSALEPANTTQFWQNVLIGFLMRVDLMCLDRATWHQEQAVQGLLAADPRLEQFAFPSACRDLDLQEDVRKLACIVAGPITLMPSLMPCAGSSRGSQIGLLFKSGWL
jgi:hypothetical protein